LNEEQKAETLEKLDKIETRLKETITNVKNLRDKIKAEPLTA